MCTAISFKGAFGRNLDLDRGYGEKPMIIGRNFSLPSARFPLSRDHYRVLGIGFVAPKALGGLDYPLLFDGINEKGLGVASLNFPSSALAEPSNDGGKGLAPHEVVPYLLAKFSSAKEAVSFLRNTIPAALPLDGYPLATLHYLITDSSEAYVAEPTATGFLIYPCKTGVLTNNPPYPFQLSNLDRHLNETDAYPEDRFGAGATVDNVGMGAIGLPGDFSSASRFVKASFLLRHGEQNKPVFSAVRTLEGVAMFKGTVKNKAGDDEYTIYTDVYDLKAGKMLYRPWESLSYAEADLNDDRIKDDSVGLVPLNL